MFFELVSSLMLRLSEWMVCAGVDLQMADPKMRSQHPMEWNLGVVKKILLGPCSCTSLLFLLAGFPRSILLLPGNR